MPTEKFLSAKKKKKREGERKGRNTSSVAVLLKIDARLFPMVSNRLSSLRIGNRREWEEKYEEIRKRRGNEI